MRYEMNDGYAICLNKWALDKSINGELGLLLIISSLCAEKGYCYASNTYLAELFGIPEQSISRKLKKLKDKGYIEIQYTKKGCEVISREIRLTNLLTDDYQNRQSTINKNVKENNTSIKNTSIKKRNIKEKFIPPSVEEVERYVSENKLDVDSDYFYKYFETGNWIDSQGKPVKNWKQKLLTWDRNNKKKHATASREGDILKEMMKELDANE